MPIPNFTETLGGSLGLGMTVINDGNFFENGGSDGDGTLPDIAEMNAEVSGMKGDDAITFMENKQEEDTSFLEFLNSKELSHMH